MLEILCEYNMYFFLLNVFFEFSMEIDCFIYQEKFMESDIIVGLKCMGIL